MLVSVLFTELCVGRFVITNCMKLKIERFEWPPVVQCHMRSTLNENRSIVLKIWSVGTLRSICVVTKHWSLDILSNFEYHLSHFFCLFLYLIWVNKNIIKCPSDQHRGPVFGTRASYSGSTEIHCFTRGQLNWLRFFLRFLHFSMQILR